jgi:transcriptional regulator with XRE-family HTH domain
MPLNTALKFACIESGKKQFRIAAEVGLPESTFSKIVNGHLEATADQKRAIAKAVRRPVAHLFPEAVAS